MARELSLPLFHWDQHAPDFRKQARRSNPASEEMDWRRQDAEFRITNSPMAP